MHLLRTDFFSFNNNKTLVFFLILVRNDSIGFLFVLFMLFFLRKNLTMYSKLESKSQRSAFLNLL